MADRHRCSACSRNFASLKSFDEHRRILRITRTHSDDECYNLIQDGQHPLGDCWRLRGHCKIPEGGGWVCRDDVFYSPADLLVVEKMEKARAVRSPYA